MIEPSERRGSMTALPLRVAVMGMFALVIFAIVFFRLWYLEVLSGDQYVSLANNNRVRDLRVQAPRGEIVDRDGRVIVTNRQATTIQLDPTKLPDAERAAANEWGHQVTLRLRRHKGHRGPQPAIPPAPAALAARLRTLSHVVGLSTKTMQQKIIQQLALVPYSNVTLKTDVPRSVLDYIAERQSQFPGVSVPTVYLRRYPFHTLAAQLLGTVGQINPAELKEKRFHGVEQGTIVGKNGLEWEYDRYLRGRDGATRLQVDALGRPKGEIIGAKVQPVPGRRLRVSIDLSLQKTGQQAVQRSMGLANANGNPAGAGAFVALDPTNGQVLAMGSSPTFDPTVFAKPLSASRYAALNSVKNGAPLYDRAIAGLYPTGSTFKPITALGALEAGVITPDTPIADAGCIEIGAAHQKFCNAGKVSNGTLSLRRALQVSSDVFFYTVGRDANPRPGEVIQTWARKLGLGHTTGIDIPGEFHGLIPDRKWRERVGKREFACRKKRHVASCGISDGRPWTVGDNVNLAVGQGDLQATPLQMAVAYSAIVNGGTVVRPHIGLKIEDSAGRLIQEIDPGANRRVSFDPAYRQAIMDGLHLAASAAGGTSADVFKGWPQDSVPVYGKTGTAQRAGQADQSWYVCYASRADGSHPLVVAVTIEKGGFGAEAAAPAARQILSQWFFGKPGKIIAGHSHTR